jgi:hypothetical protein
VTYFNSRNVAAIAMCVALVGVVNALISPLFWRVTHLPFLCDLLGFTGLIIGVWWTRKFGTATIIGLISTPINFYLNPTGAHFLGFAAASVIFDVLVALAGYNVCFGGLKSSSVSLVSISVVCATVAGFIIGTLFMNPSFIAMMFGNIFFFAGLHAAGGFLGGLMGVIIVKSLEARQVIPTR